MCILTEIIDEHYQGTDNFLELYLVQKQKGIAESRRKESQRLMSMTLDHVPTDVVHNIEIKIVQYWLSAELK